MSDTCKTFRHVVCFMFFCVFRYISSLQQAQRLLLFKQTVYELYLPVFLYTTAVDFIQQPDQTGSLNILCWNSRSSRRSEIRVAKLSLARLRHFVL